MRSLLLSIRERHLSEAPEFVRPTVGRAFLATEALCRQES